MTGKIAVRNRSVTKPALFLLVAVMTLCLSGGCQSMHSGSTADAADIHDLDISREIAIESHALGAELESIKSGLKKQRIAIPEVEAIMPVYNPLDDQIVSFSIFEEDLQVMLYSLAKSVNMNLIIDPDILSKKHTITLNLENVPASTVLNEVLASFDLTSEIKKNVIYVKQLVERVFPLNFLDTNVDTSFSLGGDVLGGNSISSGGLAGSFTMSGSGSKNGNPYNLIDEMIRQVKSPEGQYNLNRISGTLYVKDTPATIQTVAGLVNHLQEMLDRQILIEARIIEISLSDSYHYGIDWKYLRDSLAVSDVISDSLSWNQGAGIILNEGSGSSNTFGAAIDALKTFGDTRIISNPSIRAKHAQPAMISVGTSYTYIDKVTSSGGTTTDGVTSPVRYEPATANVFDGLILGVISFIEENGRITMMINPIKSDVDAASLQLVSMGGGNFITLPKVNIKELSSTISLNNHDVIILGGLIDHNKVATEEKVPLLSYIPLLFNKDYKTQSTRELVMVLQVSII